MENRIFPITIPFCFQKSPFFMLYRSVFRRILSQNVVFHKSAELDLSNFHRHKKHLFVNCYQSLSAYLHCKWQCLY